jgi:hypothetical protein
VRVVRAGAERSLATGADERGDETLAFCGLLVTRFGRDEGSRRGVSSGALAGTLGTVGAGDGVITPSDSVTGFAAGSAASDAGAGATVAVAAGGEDWRAAR